VHGAALIALPVRDALRSLAGLISFIANLVIAAWIKLSEHGRVTPSIASVVLVICMVGMIHSIWSWAPHLFGSGSRQMQAIAASAIRTERAVGLPFDWHRVPVSHDAKRQVRTCLSKNDRLLMTVLHGFVLAIVVLSLVLPLCMSSRTTTQAGAQL
jgi:hypothetical protein